MAFKIARVEERFKSPGPQPNGLHAAADGLWCIDQGDLKLYKLDWETGEVLQELQTDTEHSSGVTMGKYNVSIYIYNRRSTTKQAASPDPQVLNTNF